MASSRKCQSRKENEADEDESWVLCHKELSSASSRLKKWAQYLDGSRPIRVVHSACSVCRLAGRSERSGPAQPGGVSAGSWRADWGGRHSRGRPPTPARCWVAYSSQGRGRGIRRVISPREGTLLDSRFYVVRLRWDIWYLTQRILNWIFEIWIVKTNILSFRLTQLLATSISVLWTRSSSGQTLRQVVASWSLSFNDHVDYDRFLENEMISRRWK